MEPEIVDFVSAMHEVENGREPDRLTHYTQDPAAAVQQAVFTAMQAPLPVPLSDDHAMEPEVFHLLSVSNEVAVEYASATSLAH